MKYYYAEIHERFGEFEATDRFLIAVPARMSLEEAKLRVAADFRAVMWPDSDGAYWFDGCAHTGVENEKVISKRDYSVMRRHLPHYTWTEKLLVSNICVDEGHTSGSVTLLDGTELNWELDECEKKPSLAPSGLEGALNTHIEEEIMAYLLLQNLRPTSPDNAEEQLP